MDISHLCLVTNLGSLSVSLRLSGEDGFGIDASVYLLKGTLWNRAAFTMECALRPETNCASTCIFTVADNNEELRMAENMDAKALRDEVARLNALAHSIMLEREHFKAEAKDTKALKEEVARLNALAHAIMVEREQFRLDASKCLNRPFGHQKCASFRDTYQSHFFHSSGEGEHRGSKVQGDVDM